MTKPIRLEHLDDCAAWWGGPERERRVENERAWKVSIDAIRERGFNLDIKNPHVVEDDWGDPETLLNELTKAGAKPPQDGHNGSSRNSCAVIFCAVIQLA